MKMKLIVLIWTVFLFLAFLDVQQALALSEEARRFFHRGLVAFEIAKTPEEYEKAIKEFEKAARLAPEWPDVYLNLGTVQEKAERYRDAIESLKQYLRLAPNAADAAKVREHIYKLEYKAEQALTPKDYTDIFVSLANKNVWTLIGEAQGTLFQYGPERIGDNMVKLVTVVRGRPIEFKVIKIDHGKIRCGWTVYRNSKPPYYPLQQEHEIEIVSRNQVKVKTTQTDSIGVAHKIFTYEFIKK